jgi:hypothetical protein
MSTEIAPRKLIQETIAGQDEADFKPHIKSRSWGIVYDQQNGSYSNQVSWDLSGIVAQNGFMGLEEMYGLNPVCIDLTSGTELGANVDVSTVVLKDSSYSNFINSLQLFVNNKQIIDQTNFTNIILQELDKLTMSSSDLKMFGASLGVDPDSTTSIRYTSSAGTSGDGVHNNTVGGFNSTTIDTSGASATFQTSTVANYLSANDAVKRRMLKFSTNSVVSTDIARATLMPYFTNDGVTRKRGRWSFPLFIPFGRCADILSKYPLVKGSQVRIVANINAGSVVANLNTTGQLSLKSSAQMIGGSTFPAMFTETTLSGLKSSSGTAELTLSFGIQKDDSGGVKAGYPGLPQCRLYVPTYEVNPTYEQRLLENREQVVRYLDWYYQPTNKVINTGSFGQTLTTALPNVKLLIGVPFLNADSNVFADTALKTNQYQSPFDTAPATNFPGLMSAFTNFNVQINGVNILNTSANYTYDIWAQQVAKLGLNAGMVRQLSSGLIDEISWMNSPFVVVDISDRGETTLDTYQSVNVSGNNNSGKTVDYMWFIGFEKVVKFDVITGDVEKVFG